MPGLRQGFGVLVACLLATPAFSQSTAKAEFVRALGQFSLALDGTYGDEGAGLLASLQAGRRALETWDGFLRAAETAAASDLQGAPAAAAVRLHVALGGLYLDRLQVEPSRRALAAALTLDPDRVDSSLQGLLAINHRQFAGDPAMATAALRRAVDLEPDNPARLYELARHLSAQGQEDEARAARQRFLALDRVRETTRTRMALPSPFIRVALVPESAGVEPFFPPVRYAEGYAPLRQGDFALALDRLAAAAARDPLVADTGPHREPMQRAAAAFRDGDVAAAVSELTRAAALAPTRAEPQRLLGLVHAADGAWDAAVAALRRAMTLAPDDERVRIALAETLFAAGRLDAAIETLHDTLQVLPASGRAHWLLARVYQREGRYDEAIAAFDASLAHHPLVGANGIHQTMGTLHAAQQAFDRAIEAYSARVDVAPNDVEAHLDLGRTYLRIGQHDEALVELSMALLLDPWHARVAVLLAQAHQRAGDHERAVDAARRALELEPEDAEARYVLATSLVRLGHVDEGTRELNVYQRHQDDAAAARARALEIEALKRRAAVETAGGRHADAAVLRRQVAALEPRDGEAHLALGEALVAAGDFSAAIEPLETAVRLGAHPESHRLLGDAYAALGRTEQSAQARQRYAALKRDALRQRGARR